MFSRRVFCSSAIPSHMYRSLHINSIRQAQRVLPPMIALTPSLTANTSSIMRMAEGTILSNGALASTDGSVTALPAVIELLASMLAGCGEGCVGPCFLWNKRTILPISTSTMKKHHEEPAASA